MYIEDKNCLNCNKIIRGRSDKKYCDDYCRNTFNNLKKFDENSSKGVYLRQLNINWKILDNILEDGVETVRIPKDRLLRQGYDFKFRTHEFTNSQSKKYIYCFDYGYLELEEDWVLVVRDLKSKRPLDRFG
ncbi:hypothetical protein P872_07285 [Rhodonellum psychrophilum GCM71 = DSM 17998]|uniref:DUF2116 family Zn-ribbon domain-containing protein n=2 Tax=Rhodonellum TaxID=336827 RepID=U5C1Z3_9BACT|nr:MULTISPECIES: hypothetical protein [Rhodonellum]ERM82202.1 hypothetical protein P872_07285 [Rhodonellum psychrophilum GCM71 = DSM 17998]MDO9551519.1 hypothetical protein [Rhodonellum sp.]SDZ41003.1 hypothetical protein SAMN05444412_11384 [Rhodonellum ikkaensis]